MSHLPAASRLASTGTIDELAGHCFGCGPKNPQGLHLSFVVEAHDPITATATFELTRLHEGAPGYIHGGIIATLLDEAMSKLNRPLNVFAMARSMTVDYLRPAPLGVTLLLSARHERRDGRKLYQSAELREQSGTVLARATGLFVVIDPAMLVQSKLIRLEIETR